LSKKEENGTRLDRIRSYHLYHYKWYERILSKRVPFSSFLTANVHRAIDEHPESDLEERLWTSEKLEK